MAWWICSLQLKHYKQTQSFMIWGWNPRFLWLQTIHKVYTWCATHWKVTRPTAHCFRDRHTDGQIFKYQAKTKGWSRFWKMLPVTVWKRFGRGFILSYLLQTFSSVNSGFNSAVSNALGYVSLSYFSWVCQDTFKILFSKSYNVNSSQTLGAKLSTTV